MIEQEVDFSSSNIWNINGNLSFLTIANIEKISSKQRKNIDENQIWNINFKDEILIDSAGLAWLIKNVKFSKNRNITLQLNGFKKNKKAYLLSESQGILDFLPLYNKTINKLSS